MKKSELTTGNDARDEETIVKGVSRFIHIGNIAVINWPVGSEAWKKK